MGRATPPNPRLGNLEMWVPGSVECDRDGGGCQKVDHSESALARSRAGVGHGT